MESYRRGSLKEAESLTDYRQKKVGVIGAGVSGLLATKYLLSIGLKPTVFEAKEGLGGIWRQTFASTKTQTPRPAYQFTDFPWLSHVTTLLPNHNQKIDGESIQWYHFDFLVLSIGKYGGLPKIPSFPVNKGPEVFEGKVLHTMDYSAFNEKEAYETVKGKRVVIIGYQKSAMDFAVECAEANQGDNGPPCTMVFRRTHWMIPEDYLFWGVHLQYLYCTRFTQFLLGKPNQGFLLNLIAFLFSPLRWAINKFVELSELWRFPLKKYGLVPDMSFLEAITSCNIGSFPDKLFPKVEEGLIRFRKSSSWSFYNKGIVLDDGSKMEADVVVLGTGYDGDKKLKSLLPTKFGDVIEKSGGALSLYRGLIHPHIPQIAILGYSESLSNLHSSEIRSQWLAHFLSNKLVMPSVKEMEKNAKELEKYLEGIAGAFFWKTCHATFQITDNDDLCRDMGRNPMRKANWFDEIFSPYSNMDYGLEN
ncbi:hypothetical protein SUGI_0070640 [Cryptomeria japonica]|nr:hypothetical protein SUGI_0070640 [Cryptomeria japonica]